MTYVDSRQAFATSEDASSLIESALTLTVLCSLLFCFMEIALIFYSTSMISQCAREGTRYAIFHGASCPTSSNPTCEVTASGVNSYVSGLGWPNIAGGTMTVSTTYPNGSEVAPNPVKVTVTYVFKISMPLVPTRQLTFSSTSQMNIVQ
jgi:Flp pilus assembly protein TadG